MPTRSKSRLGTANQMEPAPADQGQPTTFLPGRQRAAFRIKVPADFKGKFAWTLTYGGVTQTATASLDQNYSLDVGDPEPPTVKAPADVSARVNQPVTLTPIVAPAPRPPVPPNADIVARRSAGAPISVWWSKFRGPGTITFGEGRQGGAVRPDTAEPGAAAGQFSRDVRESAGRRLRGHDCTVQRARHLPDPDCRG